jgi:5-methylcytosine-specific restriction endonuclease McrA
VPWEGNPRTTTPTHPNRRRASRQRDPIRQSQACKHHQGTCTQPSTQADHITPWSQQGPPPRDNGQGLCQPCHAQKTAREANTTRWAGTRRPPEAHPGLR